MRQILIIGLGNPGQKYEHTRHNLGVRIVRAWVAGQKHFLGNLFAWKVDRKLPGEVARVSMGDARVTALFPHTFMNDSGKAVQALLRQRPVEQKNILIVHDELELPFGQLNIRNGGSAKGHNGVRSIHDALGTQDTSRLQIGVGRPAEQHVPIDRFVLMNLTAKEEETLHSKIVPEAITTISQWVENR